MTLLTHQIEAGWHEVEAAFGEHAAEKVVGLPGATASTIRVTAESAYKLIQAVSLREGQLAGRLDSPKDVVTNDGSSVTDGQHEALKTDGVAVKTEPSETVAPDRDEEIEAKNEEIATLRDELVLAHDSIASYASAYAVAKDENDKLAAELAAANEALTNALKDAEPQTPDVPEQPEATPPEAVEETAPSAPAEDAPAPAQE